MEEKFVDTGWLIYAMILSSLQLLPEILNILPFVGSLQSLLSRRPFFFVLSILDQKPNLSCYKECRSRRENVLYSYPLLYSAFIFLQKKNHLFFFQKMMAMFPCFPCTDRLQILSVIVKLSTIHLCSLTSPREPCSAHCSLSFSPACLCADWVDIWWPFAMSESVPWLLGLPHSSFPELSTLLTL